MNVPTYCNAFTMVLLAALLFLAAPSIAFATPINAVIGDASWVATHGGAAPDSADEVERIQTHLFYVIDLLDGGATEDLTVSQRTRRQHALGGLRSYAADGVFPRRISGDGFGPRQPRFIDDRGVHCAVGEMLRQSGHGGLASSINARWEYAYVEDIQETDLLQWAQDYGFTRHELAMIQPGYAWREPEPPPVARAQEAVEEIARSMWDDASLLCRRNGHDALPQIGLLFTGGAGIVTLVGDRDDDFAECMREFFSQQWIWFESDRGQQAPETAFQFTLTLPVRSVASIARDAVALQRISPPPEYSCADPYTLEEGATLQASLVTRFSSEPAVLTVRTDDPRVDHQCVKDTFLRSWLPELQLCTACRTLYFSRGPWDVEIVQTIEVVPAPAPAAMSR